jgi:Ca-activated chloride channel family protein
VPASGQVSISGGKVVMEDGSPPPKGVLIQRVCGANRTIVESVTNRDGEYLLRATPFESMSDWSTRQLGMFGLMKCYLKASLSGYESSTIDLDDPKLGADRRLPPLVLRRRSGSKVDVAAGAQPPRPARKAWEAGMRALGMEAAPEAERQFREAVKKAPRFAPAWNGLGVACEKQGKLDEAREAYRQATAADAKSLTSPLLLLRLESTAKNWEAAAQCAAALIQKDVNHRYPEAFLHQAVAKYHLHDLEGAAESAAQAVRLDKDHRITNAEYIYGLVLEAKRDYTGAAQHYRAYLELDPTSNNAHAVKARIANLGKPGAEQGLEDLDAVDLNVTALRQVWIPGGIQALAAAAHIDAAPPAPTFFADYCRTLIHFTEPAKRAGIPGYLDTLRAYFSAVPELASGGEQRNGRTYVTLSLAAGPQRALAERVLALLGWRVAEIDGAPQVRLGETEQDLPRHPLAAVLGIDEIAMKHALENGRSYEFEIRSEEAPLMGGDAWLALIRDKQVLPGGLAEAFVRDTRLAKLYVGLSAAGAEGAGAMVSGVGLTRLLEQHADTLARCGAAFAVEKGIAVVPGGAGTEGVWTALAGSSPRNPPAFFRALFNKDRGKLAAYYSALSHAGDVHAQFFLANPARAAAFYQAYASARLPAAAQDSFYQDVPLDDGGRLRYPGGKRVWLAEGQSEESFLLALDPSGPFLGLARLEQERKAPLSEASAEILRRHYDVWLPLFPYFVKLPALNREDFAALADFEQAVRGSAPAAANARLGEWYALVELIALGAEAGSLDGPASAAAFRRVSQALSARDFSAKAMAALRAIAQDGDDLDEAVCANLLRLDARRRTAFERVLMLQNVPRLETAAKAGDDRTTLAALTGQVYAFGMDPNGLLISEDPFLAARHDFTGDGGSLFRAASLKRLNRPPGSHMTGGFVGFQTIAGLLARGGDFRGRPVLVQPVETATPMPAPAVGPVVSEDYMFRSDVRLVEVYATVLDSRGRYMDDLTGDDFVVLEDGKPVPVTAFEPRSSSLSCALLLDATLSMRTAFPTLKNSALELIGKMRPADSVAVYTFNESISVPRGYTADKDVPARAVARTEVQGGTALYDALTRVIRDLSAERGKRVIVMFTDGEDNSSTLTADTAVRRAKAAGIPVYTVAQGIALDDQKLLNELHSISKATGGLMFAIRDARQIEGVFDAIAKDLAHGYLLTLRPSPGARATWRKLEVVVRGSKDCQVRAREGYFAE